MVAPDGNPPPPAHCRYSVTINGAAPQHCELPAGHEGYSHCTTYQHTLVWWSDPDPWADAGSPQRREMEQDRAWRALPVLWFLMVYLMGAMAVMVRVWPQG